ncbi:carboxymuconolactone decarboxylase family protein [Herbiconiux sp. UC225_62]|uniref:carboxymuconolactone decarboxylase family protein n=1 Tax=Herbiconiux sp. UC225_62 TaxID=3350168 RepID=UPI0036D26D2F
MNARLGVLGEAHTAEEAEQQRELVRRFTTGRRVAAGTDFSLLDDDGRLTGPPATWQLSPGLGLALEPLAEVIRYSLSLPRRVHEIVILATARVEDNDFERWAHIRAGRAAGLSDSEIDELLGGSPRFTDPAESAAYDLARLLLSGQPLGDIEFDDAVSALGRTAVFEIVTLVGYYRMMALQLRAFDVRPPS